MSIINRRKFFNKISIGAVAAFVLSNIPSKLFGSYKKKDIKNIKVKIHPDSVKRNK